MPIQKINKEEIILRSQQIFRKQGYHRTSMKDIGKACGLLKGSIYHYFAGKEELMIAVLQSATETARQHVFAIAYDQSLPAQKRLKLMMDVTEQGLLGDGTGNGGCLFGTIGLETSLVVPQITQVVRQTFDVWMAAFEFIYKEKFDKRKAKKLARQSMIDFEGGTLLTIIYDDTEFFKQAKLKILSYLN